MEILRNRSNHGEIEARNRMLEGRNRVLRNAIWKLGHVAFVDP
jgi:hypothetical protein